jgi:MFS family permease
MSSKIFMTMLGLSITFILAEATPLFLVTCFTIISYDLKAMDRVIWILVTPYISTGAIAPFVGNLSDLLGRRGIILVSLVGSVASAAIQGAAPNFACYIAGSALNGAAMGVQLLTVVAAASELVPVSKRGMTIGFIVLGFMPFAPASLYGQLMAEKSWRYVYLFLGAWSILAFIVLFIWYRPARPNSGGLTRTELLKRIDYVGCILSVLGVVLFLVGINWGGSVCSVPELFDCALLTTLRTTTGIRHKSFACLSLGFSPSYSL